MHDGGPRSPLPRPAPRRGVLAGSAALGITTLLLPTAARATSPVWGDDPSAPSAPSGLRVVASATTAELAWTAATPGPSGAITDYSVEYAEVDEGTTGTWTAVSRAASTVTRATVTGLDGAKGYVFRVSAVATATTGPATAQTVPLARGGDTVAFDGAVAVHTFTTVASAPFVVSATGPAQLEYLIVGGGGGGGFNHGAGGGAGGLLSGQRAWEVRDYPVLVGGGGAGATAEGAAGGVGSSSMFDGIYASGGGGGGTSLNPRDGTAGGSGGGASGGGGIPGSGTAGQGNDGGAGSPGDAALRHGGGGGGAGAVGGAATDSQAGTGGDGVESSITGTATYYAGGGGGGGYTGSHAAGGLGGGGRGSSGSTKTDGLPGSDGLGGGGGAGSASSGLGGRGGSGVVIVRYSLAG